MAVVNTLTSSNTSAVATAVRQGGLLRNSFTIYAKEHSTGTWAGGSHIEVEVTPDGDTWFETDVDLTAEGFATIQVRSVAVKVKITSPSTDQVDVWVV